MKAAFVGDGGLGREVGVKTLNDRRRRYDANVRLRWSDDVGEGEEVSGGGEDGVEALRSLLWFPPWTKSARTKAKE